MMKKIVFVLLFAVCMPGSVLAVDWHDGKLKACGNNNADITLYEHGGGEKNFMAAVDYNENGLKLCPMGAYSWRNKTTQRPWVSWVALSQNTDCFWMCTEGWTGAGCNIKVDKDKDMKLGRNCNTVNLSNIDYAVGHSGTHLSPKIFDSSHNDCSGESDKNPWHYTLPGVVRFTTDGHGAFVAELTVRACYNKSKKKHDDCGVRVYKSDDTEEKLVCMVGYKPTEDKLGCEAIDEAACAGVCTAFQGVENLFLDDEQYSVKYDHKNNCMTFSCAQDGYGFAGDPMLIDVPANRKCIECKSTDTEIKTIKPDGQCYTLKTGESISALDGVSVVAPDSTSKTKIADMIKKGCWKKLHPEEFKRCILDSEGQ